MRSGTPTVDGNSMLAGLSMATDRITENLLQEIHSFHCPFLIHHPSTPRKPNPGWATAAAIAVVEYEGDADDFEMKINLLTSSFALFFSLFCSPGLDPKLKRNVFDGTSASILHYPQATSGWAGATIPTERTESRWK